MKKARLKKKQAIATKAAPAEAAVTDIALSFEYEILELDPKKLHIDHSYQRKLSAAKVTKMGKKPWDPIRAGTLTCIKRSNNGVVIIDGQHRQALAIEKGIPKVVCQVFKGAKINEALEFEAVNTDRKQLAATDRLRALNAGGDRAAQEVMEVLACFNLKPGNGMGMRGRDEINCLAAVMNIYSRIGQQGLYDTLDIILQIWKDSDDALNQGVISGTAKFLEVYAKEMGEKGISVGQLIAKLRNTSLVKLRNSTRALAEIHGGSGPVNFARGILAEFNSGKKQRRLPDLLNK